MLTWFGMLAALGLHGIAGDPGVLRALSPIYGAQFFLDHGLTAFLALGGVVLAVTGAEALYADMGHFGRGPIRGGWLMAVFPALTLQLPRARRAHPPAPGRDRQSVLPARPPLGAPADDRPRVRGHEAVISGAFSVTHQAVQLGYLPRLRIRQTSPEAVGQIYVSFMNWTLLVAVLILVFAFQRSEKLASAYGVAVIGTITITLVLFLVFMRRGGKWRAWQIALAAGVFGTVDVAFLGANLDKLLTGGWLPIIAALAIYTVFSTWQQGSQIVTRNRERQEGSLADFIELLRIQQPHVQRVPGTAVFLHRGTKTTPLAMRENVERNHPARKRHRRLDRVAARPPYRR